LHRRKITQPLRAGVNVAKNPRKPGAQPIVPETELKIQDQPVIKNRTGIRGFDDISGGGLPENRMTAIIGGPGAGKTVFALQVLVNRFKMNSEPAIFVPFEESAANIRSNMSSFDWGSDNFGDDGVTFVPVEIPSNTIISGSFDLIGLLEVISSLKEETGARNIAFDGIDILLSNLKDPQLERQELARLDEWVRGAGMSALITVKSFGTSDRDQMRSGAISHGLRYSFGRDIHEDNLFAESTNRQIPWVGLRC
jgi:KaiC/GvpD/RAD55 family RecA-like ATPase